MLRKFLTGFIFLAVLAQGFSLRAYGQDDPPTPPGPALATVAALPPAQETPAPTAVSYPPPVDTATEPPPTETTTETPPPGEPDVDDVEPSQISSETGGPVSIYGSGFVPGTVVRLVGYGLLDSTVVNSTALRAVVPAGLKKGMRSLEVIFPDGSSIHIGDAFRITSPKDPTATPTASGGSSVFAQPQMVIQAARTDPEVLRPGSPFTLTFELVNQGSYSAGNVRVSLGANTIAIPRESSSLRVIDLLARDQSVELSLPLALSATATTGYQSLEIIIEYYDYLGQAYKSSQNLGLNVSNNLANQPMVLLSAYSTEPGSLSPGDMLTLNLEVTNVGQNDAGQVLVTLGGDEGGGIKPFAILGASNVKFFPALKGGETRKVQQQLILDGAAESGVYNLTVSLAYDDAAGARRTESQVINLLVNRRPQLQVDFYRPPDPALVGQELTLPIEMVNIGRKMVNISSAEVSGAGLEIINGSAYIGALDGGTAGTLDAVVIPQQSGKLPVLVRIDYLDDFNQAQVFSSTLTLEVEAPPTPVPGAESGEQAESGGAGTTLLKIVRGLLGLGS